MVSKKTVYLIVIAILVLVIAFFVFNDKSPSTTPEIDSEEELPDWREIVIKDVLTGDDIVISEINKPILLESFAVWCPTCLKQQKEVKKLHDEIGDSFVSISIDTDANEDADQVVDHANKNDLDWIFVVASSEMTQSLIDEFGLRVISAPSAPIVLICPDGSSRLLKSGVKSPSELKTEIDKC